MSVVIIRALMIRLRDLICDAYTDEEFAELMFENVTDFEYVGLPAKLSYQDKVFEAVRWANRYGQTKHVLWLAELASKNRPKRNDLKKLIAELAKEIEPDPPAAPHSPVVPAGPLPLPTDLETSLALLETKPRELVVDLRPKFRNTSYTPYDLPGRFHLSDSEGRRLVAVLALEAVPDSAYLRWLAERVTVEKPFVGFTATQALTTAALGLSAAQLAGLRRALDAAVDQLDGLVEGDDQLALAFDIAARKRQLQAATSLLDMRLRKSSVLPPEDFDRFLTSFVRAFDRAGLEELCRKQLQISLKFLANLEDPIELIIVHTVITARDKGWLPDLISAASAERPENDVFANIRDKYGPTFGAAA